jgi:hypothetical protein
MALAGLDNLCGARNQSGMVIADYGDQYQLESMRAPSPVVKPDPDAPPAAG